MPQNWNENCFKDLNEQYREGSITKETWAEAKDSFDLAWKALSEPQNNIDRLCRILRTLSISFEIMETYLNVPDDIAKKMLPILSGLLSNTPAELSKTHFFQKILEFLEGCGQTITWDKLNSLLTKRNKSDEEKRELNLIFCALATELILLNIGGINILYRQNKDDEGLKQLNVLFKYIKLLQKEKEKIGHDKPNSLLALAKYFEGKFLFAKGEHEKAIESFEICADNYHLKLLYSNGNTDEEYSSRMIAQRRYCLAKLFGCAMILQSKGNLHQALDLCERYIPALGKNTNKILHTYSRLIQQVVLRGLYSDDNSELEKILKELEDIKSIFNNEVPKSHYVYRTEIQICIAKLFQAQNSINNNEETFDSIINSIDDIITSDPCKDNKNVRLHAEALSLKSYALRNYPIKEISESRSEPDEETSTESNPTRFDLTSKKTEYEIAKERKVKEAINCAVEAVKLSEGKQQQHCDCLIELALAYKAQFFLKHEEYQRLVRDSQDLNSGTARSLASEIRTAKRNTVKQLFNALRGNKDQNKQISAIAWLQLTDVELLRDHNVDYAIFNLQKYRELEPIEHRYILSFADEVQRKTDRIKLYAPPFFTGEEDSVYDYRLWKERLEEPLTKKVILTLCSDLGKNVEITRKLLVEKFQKELNFPEQLAEDWADKYMQDGYLEELLKKKKSALENDF